MAYYDIDLRDFDADELIDALEHSYLDIHDKRKLSKLIHSTGYSDAEDRKIEYFLSVMNQYSLGELWERLGDRTIIPVSPNQLKLTQLIETQAP